MTLFASTERRVFIINDVYIMTLTFLTCFLADKVINTNNTKNIELANLFPWGKNWLLKVPNDNELTEIILTSIANIINAIQYEIQKS